MNEFFSHTLTPVILIYVVSGMLALELSQTVKQIIEPLNRTLAAKFLNADYQPVQEKLLAVTEASRTG